MMLAECTRELAESGAVDCGIVGGHRLPHAITWQQELWDGSRATRQSGFRSCQHRWGNLHKDLLHR